MAGLDFRQVAKKLGDEYQVRGYKWRLEGGHTHPRLYICSNGEERFTILSSTANYNEGNLLSMKRQDIERDVIPHLPKPIMQPIKANGDNNAKTKTVLSPEEIRVYKIKVFIGAKGTLSVVVPAIAIPTESKLAQPMLFDGKFGLVFSSTNGKKSSGTRAKDKVCYYFARKEVPFEYAQRTPENFKAPDLCARRRGNSLVCDKPLPSPLLDDSIIAVEKETKKKISERQQHTLQDGSDLRIMINDWLTWARKQGHDPKLGIAENGELTISISVKVKKEL